MFLTYLAEKKILHQLWCHSDKMSRLHIQLRGNPFSQFIFPPHLGFIHKCSTYNSPFHLVPPSGKQGTCTTSKKKKNTWDFPFPLPQWEGNVNLPGFWTGIQKHKSGAIAHLIATWMWILPLELSLMNNQCFYGFVGISCFQIQITRAEL